MNIGIGIDLVAHEEVRDSVRRHGRRYLERVYTARELGECAGDALKLAARFAAKEATMKALGRHDEPMDWRSIQICVEATGWPSLELSGDAAALARRRGFASLSVSLSHTSAAAAAVVLARREG